MQYISITCLVITIFSSILLQGCKNKEVSLKKNAKNNLREYLTQRPMVSFKDPEAKTLLDKNNILLDDVRIFSTVDVKKIFGDILSGEIIEKKSVTSNRTKEKTFIINQRVAGVPVFAASTILRCSSDGKIISFSCNFSVPATKMKDSPRQFPPEMQQKFFGKTQNTNVKHIIFDPALVGKKEKVVMTWQIDINGQRIFIDQKTKKEVYSYPLYAPAVDMNKDVK